MVLIIMTAKIIPPFMLKANKEQLVKIGPWNGGETVCKSLPLLAVGVGLLC